MNQLALPPDISAVVRIALAEDIGTGDVSAALIDRSTTAHAILVAKEPAILCGAAWFDEVFRQLDVSIAVAWQHPDGMELSANSVVCELRGPAATILSGERTALNFLQTLSATATSAHQFASAVAHTQTRILDTRKTLPCLRSAQKYAVRCGGAHNHRSGLFDAVLLKENHISALGSISLAAQCARENSDGMLVEVEVETIKQFEEALSSSVDRLLLDNFSLAQLRQAVALRDAQTGRTIELEVSGNVALDNVRTIAEIGVDWISVGAITKNVRAIDYSLRFADQATASSKGLGISTP